MLIGQKVTAESDPRPGRSAPPTPPDFRSLHTHNPWADSDPSDPDEADVEEHVTHGPGGSIFIQQTIRSRGRPGHGNRLRRSPAQGDPNDVMQDFQNMLGTLMGPNFRPGQPGRSGYDDLFPPPPMGFRFGPNGNDGVQGSRIIGGRFTYTTGGLNRNTDEPQAPPDLATYASLPSPTPFPLTTVPCMLLLVLQHLLTSLPVSLELFLEIWAHLADRVDVTPVLACLSVSKVYLPRFSTLQMHAMAMLCTPKKL